ncbi:MAG: 13E12 repeat family protein [Actinomycetia bacterium]|nr:13E12 repeat family protein [Actinomycetes bacterium]
MQSQPDPIAPQVTELVISGAPLGDLDGSHLVDLPAQLDRLANAAGAAQAEVMVEMSRRAEHTDDEHERQRGRTLLPHERRAEFVPDEAALTLASTKASAAHRYGLALSVSEHPAVLTAWRRGTIDARKVQVICDSLTDVSSPTVEVLADQAVGYAASRTAPELRRWLSRRVIAADPGVAEVRRTQANADRKVTVTSLADGVCELYALLPSVQARQVYDSVNTLAHACAADDARTMDQRRADALMDLICGRADPPQVTAQVVVPIDTLLAESAEPGNVAGVGPITASQALQLAGIGNLGGCSCCDISPGPHDVAFRRLLTDPDTGYLLDVAERQYRPSAQLDRSVRSRDGVCRFPGCNRPTTTTRSGTDLDHTIPRRAADHGGQPRRPLPAPPSPEALTRVEREAPFRRRHGVVLTSRQELPHRALVIRRRRIARHCSSTLLHRCPCHIADRIAWDDAARAQVRAGVQSVSGRRCPRCSRSRLTRSTASWRAALVRRFRSGAAHP